MRKMKEEIDWGEEVGNDEQCEREKEREERGSSSRGLNMQELR